MHSLLRAPGQDLHCQPQPSTLGRARLSSLLPIDSSPDVAAPLLIFADQQHTRDDIDGGSLLKWVRGTRRGTKGREKKGRKEGISSSCPLPPFISSKMIFSPVLVVALSTLLVSPTLASPLVARQAASNSSSTVVDPHQAPDVPSNHTSPIAYGGVAWADAFSKAKALVEQMTVEEKSNITSGWVEVTFPLLFLPSLTYSVLASPASLALAREAFFPLFLPLTLTFLLPPSTAATPAPSPDSASHRSASPTAPSDLDLSTSSPNFQPALQSALPGIMICSFSLVFLP